MKSLPTRLYKYESFSPQALENLKAHRIFFGSPLGFNDPYDCAVSPVVLEPSLDEVECVRKHYLQSENTPHELRTSFKSLPPDEMQQMLWRSGKAALESANERFLKERGVSCFSEVKDDLLMWGHYGGKYKGFCLEFSTKEEPFPMARPVKYFDRVPSTSVVPFILGRGVDEVTDFYCVKAASWAYEREWRVFHTQVGTLFHYEACALTGIYFGPEMSQEAREIICLILRGQNAGVKFYRGQRSRTEFKVEFQEFSYMTHLEAKSLGRA